MNLFAVIMAGGVGSRFWPRSKQRKPKQLIRIHGENSMIQDTVARLEGLIEPDKVYVITNKIQKPRVKDQLPEIPAENIIDEPFGKNTAPCIGLASGIIQKRCPDAVIVTLPADHLIQDKNEFQNTIIKAVKFANDSNGLVTIGIKPNRPETGYGYIQFDEAEERNGIYKVLTFAEKPNLATANRFIKSGDFLWNSGMFIWKVQSILDEIRIYMRDLYDGIKELQEAVDTPDFNKVLTRVYGQLKSISIDYGIMEKSRNVYLVPGLFDWNDVGSWEAVYQISEKDEYENAKFGEIYSDKTTKSYIFSPQKFTAVIGVENLIVIDTKDSLLVCNRNNAQDVKQVVDFLKMNKKSELI